MSTSNQTPALVLRSLMDEYQLSNMALSRLISLSPSMVNQLVSGQSKLTVSVVLRLAKVFGKTPAFWLDLQRQALLEEAKGDKNLQKIVKGISKVNKPAAKPKAVAAKKKSLSAKRKTAAKVPGAKPASRSARAKKRR